MLVKRIMTRDFETVARSAALDTVVERMLRNDVDHVIATKDDDPAGVITRRKVLIASYKTDHPLSEIPVSGFGHGLESHIGPSATVLLSVGKIQQSNLECLPVVDGMQVVGVLTKDDILENVSNITSEVLDAEDRREEWTQPADEVSSHD
jgi:Predicted signal-transduction protein containing cAMP-binding and CBS domains